MASQNTSSVAMAFPTHLALLQTVKPDPPCLLLQLPAELRLQIYSYLLTPPAGLLSDLRRNHRFDYLIPCLGLCPSILGTCKMIHDEAAPILYKSSVYCAHTTQLISSPFLVSPDRPIYHSRFKNQIKKWYISVRLDIDARFTRRDVQKAFSGCDSLEILAWQVMFGSVDLHILKLFEDVRGVRQAKVYGSVGRRYSKWLEDTITSDVGTVVEELDVDEDEDAWELWTHGNR